MPFFEDEVPHLIRQKEKRARVAVTAVAANAAGRANGIKRLMVDYPWLSPGVATALSQGGYDPAQAKQIALDDLRSQYQQNPAKFGDFKDNQPRKRLKSWIQEFDSYLHAADTGTSPSALDITAAEMNRGFRFQGATNDEIRQLRQTAKRALESGDGIAMTAALGIINKRSTGEADPFTQQRSTGLTPQAQWVGDNVLDPLVNTTEKFTMPATRAVATAANTLNQGVAAGLRLSATTQSIANAPTDSAAMGGGLTGGPDPLELANQRAAQGAQTYKALSEANGKYGPILGPIAAIAAQTEGGQAIKALASGEPVDLGGGYLPKPDSQTAQAAAAAARHYSPYLIDGHAWTPGRAMASSVFNPESTAFTVASGLIDATVAIQADPAAAGLAWVGNARRAASAFENVNDAAGIVRTIEGAADDTAKADLLAEMGVVNGRRPLLRGHNPVSWLYGKGDAVVTRLTEETDPWTIWNATGRKFDVDLVNRLADSTDKGVTRQILAGELGTTVDKVPSYTDGYYITPRSLTDLPTGRLDLAPEARSDAAHLIDQYLVLMKAPESTRAKVFNNLVRSAGRGDDYATVDAVFDAFKESMVAAGAPADKAEALSKWARTTWDDAQKWGVDAETGDNLPVVLHLGDETVEVPFGPRMPQERFKTTVDMPDPRAVKRLVASPEFAAAVQTDQWAGLVGVTDKAYGAWKVFKLARPAWTVKVVGDEQARIMAVGLSSLLNHPIQTIAIALGNPQEGTFFGRSWYERIEGIGKRPDSAQIEAALTKRAEVAQRLVDENPEITRAELFAALDKEAPVPKSVGAKASGFLRSQKFEKGRLKTDITGATMDARPGIGGDYAAGLTGRFSDFSASGTSGRQIYLSHFDAVARDSEHWARGLVEETARLASEPATRRAMRLSPEEFMDEMWSKPWGKAMREQMAAGRDPGDPWLMVLKDRRYSDAYAQEYLRHLENFIGGDDSIRVALVNGKLDGVPITDDWGYTNPAAVDKAGIIQAEGRGPNYVKVQRAVTQRVSEREKDIAKWNAAVNSLFDGLMTRPSNYLSRHPTFMQKYWGDVEQLAPSMSAEARTQLLGNLDAANLPPKMEIRVRAAIQRATGTEGMGLDEADLILKKRALDFTRGTLYDLSKKSNIMDTLRFVFPFGEAFKEVLSVWAKIAVEQPQTLRRVQQGIQGAREAVVNTATGLPTGSGDPMGAGFFRHDPQTGQEVFTIPGSGWLSRIATGGDTIALKSPVQGLNMVGSLSPGVGPAISIPASFLLPNKPAWDGVRKILFPFGQPSTGNPLAIPGTEFAPTWVKNLAKVVSDPRSDRLYANTVMDIAAAKASTGDYGVSGDPNSHDEINRLLHDSMKSADWLYTIRALASATAPSAPGFDAYVKKNPDDDNLILLAKLRDEYRKMTDEHGWDEGFKKFIEKFGVDNLLATGSKSAPNVAGLDTSPEQRKWARSNADLVESLPETWALFAPTGKSHDQSAYEAQIASGQRDPVDPRTAAQRANDTLAKAIIKNRIETQYGGSVDTAGERADLREVKAQLAREYDGYEPEFQGAGRTAARIRELERAVGNPKIANTRLGQALSAYFSRREEGNQIARDRGYSEVGMMDAEKASWLRDDLRDYAKWLIDKEPAFRRMWDLVLERELAD